MHSNRVLRSSPLGMPKSFFITYGIIGRLICWTFVNTVIFCEYRVCMVKNWKNRNLKLLIWIWHVNHFCLFTNFDIKIYDWWTGRKCVTRSPHGFIFEACSKFLFFSASKIRSNNFYEINQSNIRPDISDFSKFWFRKSLLKNVFSQLTVALSSNTTGWTMVRFSYHNFDKQNLSLTNVII